MKVCNNCICQQDFSC